MDEADALDDIVSRLRCLALQIEKDKSKTFRLKNGEDITELIKHLKTEEDIIALARRIMDGTIPSINGPYEDLNEKDDDEDEYDMQEDDPEVGNGNNEIDKMDEGDDTEEDLVAKLLIDNGYVDMWDTWADFFTYFGYDHSDALKAFEMPSVYDVSIVFAGISLYEEEKVDLPEYFRIFISGKAGNDILTLFMNTLLIEYTDADENFEDEADLEDDGDVDLDIKGIRKMVEGNLEILEDAIGRDRRMTEDDTSTIKRFRDELEQHKYEVDAMMEIYGEIDEEIEKLEDMQFDDDDECDDGCDNDGTHPCERHMDDIEEELLPYPILFCPGLSKSHSEWTAKRRKVFDQASPAQEEMAMEEMRFEMSQTDLLLPPNTFRKLVQEITQDADSDVKWDDEAIKVLQEASEAYLIEQFQGWNKNAIHANRTHINPSDIPIETKLRSGNVDHVGYARKK